MSKQKTTDIEPQNTATFEEQYAQLEAIVGKMQNPSISLTDSFANYKQGMELVQSLNGMIDGIEKEVRELEKDLDFEDEEDSETEQ